MEKKSRFFVYLLALSLLFLLMQAIGFFLGTQDFFLLFQLCLHPSAMQVPLSALLGQLFFVAVEIGLCVLFTLPIWASIRLISAYWAWPWSRTWRLGFYFWLICALAVLFANEVSYPTSALSGILRVVIPLGLAHALLSISLIFIASVFLLALWALFGLIWRRHHGLAMVSGLVFVLMVGTGWILMHRPQTYPAPEPSAQPNVIIIGIDSWRPDYSDFDGHRHGFTPHLDRFAEGATNFRFTLTPLARTFPSWASVLTGEYPLHNGLRSNLANQKNIDLSHTLGALLKSQGYFTVYATDDNRFSEIGPNFGYDEVLGPGMGVNNFVLGTINDLPFTNLLLNTRLGKYLFPFTSSNRASSGNYDPQAFSRLVEENLQRHPQRPLFLNIHFCLPHWPYVWGKQTHVDGDFPLGPYTAAIAASDAQFGQFMDFLAHHGYLQHSIVILISDHGEAILLPTDRLITLQKYIKGPHSRPDMESQLQMVFEEALTPEENFDTAYGHGSDVLSLVQYHTVLAIRTYGFAKNNVVGQVTAPTLLIDIKPTILALLHLSDPGHTDGRSLVPFLQGRHPDWQHRPLFIESGFTPQSIRTGEISLQKTFFATKNLFALNPSATIHFKPEASEFIIQTKQRAVYQGPWVLALYPVEPTLTIPVLVNRDTGQWTDDLSSSFAQHSPASFMLQSLRHFYGKELAQLPLSS